LRVREVMRTFVVLGSGHVAGKLIALLSAALLARGLGPSGLGFFATAVTLLGFVLVATNWGTDSIGIREVSKHPEEWSSVNRSVRSLRLKLAVFGALATAAATWILKWDPGFVAPLAMAAFVFSLRADWLLLAMGRPQSVALASVVREIVFCGLVALAVVGTRSLRVAAWAFLAADLAWALATQWYLRRLPPDEPRGDHTRELVRDGWPMVVTSSMSLTYNKADTPMLAAMCGAAIAGTYWAAYTVIFALLGFAGILSRAALPELSRSVDERDLSKLSPLVLAASLMGGFGAMILVGSAGTIMSLLYGEAFRPGAQALTILALMLPMNFASGVLLNRLVAVGRQRLLAIASVSGAAINVGLNLLLIPRLGMRGAALATVASEAVLLGVGLAGLSGLPRARPFQVRVIWIVVSALLVGALIGRVEHSSGPMASFLLTALFSLACVPAFASMLRWARRTAGESASLSLRRAGATRLVYVTRALAPYRIALFRELRERSAEVHIVVAGKPVTGVPEASDRAASEGLAVHRCGRGLGWRRDVIEVCERLSPDLLLIEHGARIDFAWTLLATRRLPGVRRVLWTQGVDNRELYSGLPNTGTPGRWLQLWMSDGILCYHQHAAEMLSRHFPDKPITAALNSTDGRPILAARRELLARGRAELKRRRGLMMPMYLATLGRMIPNKLMHRLPRILSRVRAEVPGVGLLFIGDGPQRGRVLRSGLSQHLEEGRDFRFLGDVRDPLELTYWLLCSDLVVNPGTMGLTSTDALFSGTPVVLAHAGARGPYHGPEWKYLLDSPGGIFTRDRSDQAFADAIIAHLTRPERERLAIEEACVRYAEEHLGVEPMIRGVLEFLGPGTREPFPTSQVSLA
jgi:O-antigen/teichoic acid export membrane protein/glycosyltransferase involved in cell wall biosynthesis